MLKDISTEDLQKELDRRLKEEYKPKQIFSPNFDKLSKLCQNYIDDLNEKGWVDDDLDHYIYEAAMEAFFGKTVWDWINERT